MTDTTALLTRIDQLTSAVCLLTQALGTRLNKDQMATRLGIHRNTLRTRARGKDFPKPADDGKWALADVIRWEQGRGH
ncbi:hypothetical protein [Rhodoferax sp. BLA1]|uniref:hypothetical protein n=1 Tax=Rhodoferax sp. BLA1 TaxID=2576062 RepID=UPI0015D24D5F|nr:hypothetical protein [Rhodoferax sp. BLA1]